MSGAKVPTMTQPKGAITHPTPRRRFNRGSPLTREKFTSDVLLTRLNYE